MSVIKISQKRPVRVCKNLQKFFKAGVKSKVPTDLKTFVTQNLKGLLIAFTKLAGLSPISQFSVFLMRYV